jgi:predicted dehydrogenase
MTAAPVRLGVVGYGYWGPNLVRTLAESREVSVEVVADLDPDRLARARERHRDVGRVTTDYRDVFELGLDAVVVCTPPQTHFAIASECLEQGLDVFVEKPLATSSSDAWRLDAIARRHGRVLMVGHIGPYVPAVRLLKQMVDAGDLGDLAYVDTVRGGLGLFHPSLNVVWDLAPHDVAILMYLLDEAPISVSAHGGAYVRDAVEDVAYVALAFPSGILAHARLSWLDPCKTRRIAVVGRQKMVVYDDLEAHEKLKVYDKRVDAIRRTDTFGEHQFAYHYGSVVSPYIEQEEPLRIECRHFVECVTHRRTPLTDGTNGARVVQVIEAAQVSMREGGRVVAVAPAAPDGGPAVQTATVITLGPANGASAARPADVAVEA